MNFGDIFKMCIGSLKRRKGRTFLTALGVFIGCTSIILMVSVGAALSESQEQSIANMGDLTIINVHQGHNGQKEVKLDVKAIDGIREIAGVKGVMAKYNTGEYNVGMTAGNDRYIADWAEMAIVDMQSMSEMGYELLDGSFPTRSTDENSINAVIGQYLAYNFYDSYKSEGNNRVDRYSAQYDENGKYNPDAVIPDPLFNPLTESMKMTLSTYEENPKKLETGFKATGIIKEDYGKGWETSEGFFIDVNDYKKLVSKITGESEAAIKLEPGTVLVKATDIDSVAEVEKEIQNLGFNTSSMQSFREEMAKQMRNVELMLGGLGAISLFVAAIGITNTMIMSISERTKEIGIMKALGCYVKDIRALFLMEAGSIGLIGGVCGITFSLIASVIVNLVSMGVFPSGVTMETVKMALMGGEGITRRSAISPELVVFAIFFSIAVGVVSGYYPANKAVKISALEAIKDE